MYYFSPSEESEKRVGQPRCSFAAAAAKSLQSCPTLCPPTRLRHPWDSPGKNTGVGCHFFLQCMKVKSEVKSLSRVWLFVTSWTAAYQAPLSTGFSRWEYWSGLPLPSPVALLPICSRKYYWHSMMLWASLVAQIVKNLLAMWERPRFIPWVGKIPWRREWQPIPVFLPGEFHGQKSLAVYSQWGRKEPDMT